MGEAKRRGTREERKAHAKGIKAQRAHQGVNLAGTSREAKGWMQKNFMRKRQEEVHLTHNDLVMIENLRKREKSGG